MKPCSPPIRHSDRPLTILKDSMGYSPLPVESQALSTLTILLAIHAITGTVTAFPQAWYRFESSVLS